jgi:hypothetical protein
MCLEPDQNLIFNSIKTYPMRRLTALIKKIVPFPQEIREEFFKIVKVLDLSPGEWVPDDLPTGTLVFIEDGLLLLTHCKNKQWKCSNIYTEGMLVATFSDGASEMKNGSFRVRAAAPTRIYYWTSEDACRLQEIFPSYGMVGHILRQRSFIKSQRRRRLFVVPIEDRILYLDVYFRSLLRAPLDDLAEFLCLKTKRQKAVLSKIQNMRLSSQKQLS